MRITSVLLLALLPGILFSQSGTIKGRVLDAVTLESLPGANIFVTGTQSGTITNLDGYFELSIVQGGPVDLRVSYISYQTEIINGIHVSAGDIKILDVKLRPVTTDLEEVVVEGRFKKRSEIALLKMKGESATFMDGISSQEMSNLGVSDAAGALQRVTGLSVESGKYVYVRGLGDRYSKVTLNDAVIPGLDPNRNTVQMDIFPTGMIENMVVNKTFAANLPGDFSGGHINITTKDFPDVFTLTFSTSLGYNPQANLQSDYLSYEGGKLDWLGIDDGTRELPEAGRNIPYYSNPNKTALTDITKSFNKTMGPSKKKSFFDHSHSFSIGNQIKLFGRPLGFTAGLSYSRKHNYYDNGQASFYRRIGANEPILNKEFSYSDSKSRTDVLIGGILNMQYKLAKNHKIGIHLIRNQNGEDVSRYMYGETQTDEIGTGRETRTLKFVQRNLTSGQIKGEHILQSFARIRINWLSSYTRSRQDEPDIRFFTNGHFPEYEGTDAEFEISPSKYKVPTRLYRDLWETNFNNKLDVTVPFKFNGYHADFQFGTSHVYKNRQFSERRINYIRNTDNFNGSITEYLSDTNIGLNEQGGFGLYVQDATNTKNSYQANQSVFSQYAMINMALFAKLRVVAGIRFEQTNIFSQSENDRYAPGELVLADLLPSLNLTYALKENMNLRAAFNRTLARPTFREIAPFESEDFQGGIVYVGNPELQRTLIDNVDFRWEYFMKPGEIISVSTFYKNFINPIELADDIRSNNPQLTWQNVDKAKVLGFELEMRKRVNLGNPETKLFVGANFTLLRSYVSIDSLELISILESDPSHSGKRTMYGQAPYIVNSFIHYHNDRHGLGAHLGYNISGEKLAIVMRAPTPNVFEQSFGQLDFSIAKEFGAKKNLSLKFSVHNILNATNKSTYELDEQEYTFSRYRPGRTFSLGFAYHLN